MILKVFSRWWLGHRPAKFSGYIWKPEGATHMIVVWDSFDNEDFPVYVSADESVRERVRGFEQNGERVMEVYSFAYDIEEQLKAHHCFNYD